MRETPEEKMVGITYRKLDAWKAAMKEAERLSIEVDDARNATPKSPKMTGMPRSGNQASLDLQMEIIEAAQKRFDEARERALERLNELEDLIDQLPNYEQQRVLYFRHIYRFKWNDVADKMHWSVRTVQRIHSRALKELEGMDGRTAFDI